MEIIICGIVDAFGFVPTKPTYAIQIGTVPPIIRDLESPPYAQVFQYFFGDLYPGERTDSPHDGKLISAEIASKILTDFANHNDGIDALLVHCSRGKNRSPAVALALNEVFGLGHTREELRRSVPEIMENRHVYQELLTQAERLGLYKKLV